MQIHLVIYFMHRQKQTISRCQTGG